MDEAISTKTADALAAVILDPNGELLVCDASPLVGMRPNWSTVACGFPLVEVDAGLDPLEPIARCDRWPVADLVRHDGADRCSAGMCTAEWRPAR